MLLTPETVAAGLSAAHASAHLDSAEIVVAVVDPSGRLVGLLGSPHAFLASRDYAEWKAWTAASFRMSTEEFSRLLEKLGPEVTEGLLAHPMATRLPGGLAVFSKAGALLCAVGVSGGSAEQDLRCAEAAAAAILQRLSA